MAFSEHDEGKTVIGHDERELGVVTRVTDGAAFVEPLTGLPAPARSTLGWGGDGREEYRIDESLVAAVTGSEMWLEEPTREP